MGLFLPLHCFPWRNWFVDGVIATHEGDGIPARFRIGLSPVALRVSFSDPPQRNIGNFGANKQAMFGFLNDIGKAVGTVVGMATGPIIGLSVDLVANTLGMSVGMVKEAIAAGCRTYEEIRDFHR